ncbi:tail protein X [Pseudoxanthomonas sp. PXM02]|uniref:tail protein X n=1 Tax=Pseudoxanthomonas sp. PXM02 TaxID=2769294 RepID=UPI00178179FE|nr:tail protein X [Pseudoxanthomonas sp. PXM02]
MRVHARQGDTLDQICYRHLGATAGVVEQTLELNPGLAKLGTVLPHGTAVQLPTLNTAQLPAKRALVQLWD